MTPEEWAAIQDRVLESIVLEAARAVATVQRELLVEFHRYLSQPQKVWGPATAQEVRWQLGQSWASRITPMATKAWEKTKRAVRAAWKGVSRILTAAKERVLGEVPEGLVDQVVGDSLLRQYVRSFARYGAFAVLDVERIIAQMPGGIVWEEARERIWKSVRHVVRDRQWMVDRILRTEVSYAYHSAQHQAIAAVDARDSGSVRKRDPILRQNIATFDSRTAKDSFTVHGQLRKANEPFYNAGLAVSFLHPPDRPNDRATVVPWRRSWGAPASSA